MKHPTEAGNAAEIRSHGQEVFAESFWKWVARRSFYISRVVGIIVCVGERESANEHGVQVSMYQNILLLIVITDNCLVSHSKTVVLAP